LADTTLDKIASTRSQLQSELEERRNQAGDTLRRVADVLRNAGEQARTDDEQIGKYADLASERIERVASYVSSADLRSIVRDAEDLARRQPMLFYGGALFLGVLAGRAIKGISRPVAQAYEREPAMYTQRTSQAREPQTAQRSADVVTHHVEAIGVPPPSWPTEPRMP